MVTPQTHDWAICSCRSCQKFKNRVARKRRTMELLAISPERYRALSHVRQMRELGVFCRCFDCQVERVNEAREVQKTCPTIRQP